jgi:ribosomal-protein-alanine N-acetyltransferase
VSEVRVRSRTTEDLPACAAVLARVHEQQRYPVNWPADPERWLSQPVGPAAWVAERHGMVVGHVRVTVAPTGTVEVERLFVDPAAQGVGAGRALLGAATAWADQRAAPVVLEVADSRPETLRFYADLGWRETGRTAVDWGGDVATAVVHLERRLV